MIKTTLLKRCLTCDEIFKTCPSLIKNGKGKYCSKKCYFKSLEGKPSWSLGKKFPERSGEKHPNWRGDCVGYQGIHTWVKKHLGTPMECSGCGTTEAKKIEWANISGLYKRNFRDWKRLCVKCHRNFDEKSYPVGEDRPAAKLKEKQVLEIKKLYDSGNYFQKELGNMFNVTEASIHRIINRISWRHVNL